MTYALIFERAQAVFVLRDVTRGQPSTAGGPKNSRRRGAFSRPRTTGWSRYKFDILREKYFSTFNGPTGRRNRSLENLAN